LPAGVDTPRRNFATPPAASLIGFATDFDDVSDAGFMPSDFTRGAAAGAPAGAPLPRPLLTAPPVAILPPQAFIAEGFTIDLIIFLSAAASLCFTAPPLAKYESCPPAKVSKEFNQADKKTGILKKK